MAKKHKLTFIKHLTERNALIIIFLLATMILSSIFLSRHAYFGNFDFPASDASYYHNRISGYERSASPNFFFSSNDNLIFGGRVYQASPYHILLGLISMATGITFAQIAIPIFLGLASIIIFFFIMREFNMPLLQRTIISFMIILSPLFIHTFTSSTPNCLAVLVLLLAFYLLIYKTEKKISYLSLPLVLLIPSFGIFPAMFFAVLLIYYVYFKNKNKKNHIYFLAFAVLILSSIFLFSDNMTITSYYSYLKLNPVEEFISDLGGLAGFGIFNLLLMIFGVFVMWKRGENQNYFLFITTMIALILSIYVDPSINIYLNFFICILAANGLLFLFKLKWSVDLVKSLTGIVLICGLLFSTLSYVNRVTYLQPSKQDVEAMYFLKEHSSGRTPVVFSHYSYSHFLQNFDFVTVTDILKPTRSSAIAKSDSEIFFQTRRLKDAKDFIDKYDVSYIFITAEMKKGLVWSKEDQGLLFLLNNAPKDFRKIYSSEECEIWEYLSK
ncbi:MAG: hypothetical protein Q8O89_06330 [Nanoarchaeota archaeon]|nr:hypothetical protein [Nanoarchaeota archaeon]